MRQFTFGRAAVPHNLEQASECTGAHPGIGRTGDVDGPLTVFSRREQDVVHLICCRHYALLV